MHNYFLKYTAKDYKNLYNKSMLSSFKWFLLLLGIMRLCERIKDDYSYILQYFIIIAFGQTK